MPETNIDRNLHNVEEANHESQSLIPQTSTGTENDKLHTDFQNAQANNFQYTDYRTEVGPSKASESNIL